MFTYNELRGLLVAGEFVAAMAILIASRTVGTALNGAAVYVVIEDREYTISQTSDGLSIYLIITENSDGTFAVDEDVYGWEEAEVVGMVDENTGKNGAPPAEQWQSEFVSLAERICQILRRDGVSIQETDINNLSPDAPCSIFTSEGRVSFEYAEERSAVEIVEEAYRRWEQEAEFEEAMMDYDEEFMADCGPSVSPQPLPSPVTYSPHDQDIPF